MVAFLGLTALLAFGGYETLVLSPLAMAPDYSITEIYALLSPADRASGLIMVAIWLVFWACVVVAFLTLCLVRGRLARAFNVVFTPRRVLVYALMLAAVIIFFQGWSGFSIGMSISDTIPPMRGGRSWQGQVLLLGGALMFVAALLLALVPGPLRAAGAVASGAPAPRTA